MKQRIELKWVTQLRDWRKQKRSTKYVADAIWKYGIAEEKRINKDWLLMIEELNEETKQESKEVEELWPLDEKHKK